MKSLLALPFLLLLMLVVGCATPQRPSSALPQKFDEAVPQLARTLFLQVQQRQNALENLLQRDVVLDPFIDANTAEVTVTSKRIEQVLVAEIQRTYPKFRVAPLSPQTVEAARFLMNGVIKLDTYPDKVGTKYHRISASVVDLKNGQIVANAEAWVSDRELDATPVAVYQDSPMYLKDKRTEGLIQTAQSPAGNQADKDYFDSLSTAALLTEGDRAYEQKNYEPALARYKAASLRPDGQLMKTYAGLYQVYRKLGRQDDAEVAFGRLVVVGFQNHNVSARLMFNVASTDFINDSDLRGQYAMWLRQIARQFGKVSECLEIVGHSSHSGSEVFNETLSLQRAQQVQRLMQKDNPDLTSRSRALGRGWKENIIGSGTDDMQDAIDRRVEFKLVRCP